MGKKYFCIEIYNKNAAKVELLREAVQEAKGGVLEKNHA
jgi:hypothetical protein